MSSPKISHNNIWIVKYNPNGDSIYTEYSLVRVVAPSLDEAVIKYFQNLSDFSLKYELGIDLKLSKEENIFYGEGTEEYYNNVRQQLPNDKILEIMTKEIKLDNLEIFNWNRLPLLL